MGSKLTILFVLIGSIIMLSHMSDGAFGWMRQRAAGHKWRNLLPGRRQS